MATSIKLPAADENISPLPEPKSATSNKAHHSRTFWNRRNHESKPVRHLRKEFNGGSGRRYPYSFRKPQRELDEKVIETYDKSSTETATNADGKRAYRNPFGKVIWKYEDVDTYLSPFNYAPRRLMVQATDSVLQQDTGANMEAIKGPRQCSSSLAHLAYSKRIRFLGICDRYITHLILYVKPIKL